MRERHEAEPSGTDTRLHSRRAQGRPRNAHDEVGRRALLEAARQLLRVKQPAKITRLDIARFARVDPALIRYYFGDKSTLLTTLAVQMIEELLERLAPLLKLRKPARERLRVRVKACCQMLAENPHLNQLILEQIVHARKDATRHLRRKLAVRFFAGLETLLAEGVQNGEFRAVDPRFVHIALLGACEFFTSARGMLEELFDKRELTSALFENYAEFVSDLLVNGIGARRRVHGRHRV